MSEEQCAAAPVKSNLGWVPPHIWAPAPKLVQEAVELVAKSWCGAYIRMALNDLDLVGWQGALVSEGAAPTRKWFSPESKICLNLGFCRSDAAWGNHHANVFEAQNYAVNLVFTLSPSWKHFSGRPTYPIPSSASKLDPNFSWKEFDPWLGEAGQMRLDLLEHMTDVLESAWAMQRRAQP